MALFEVVRESLKIPFRNAKLNLSISLFLLIPISLLFLSSHFAIQPFLFDLITKAFLIRDTYLQPPEYLKLLEAIKKDVGILVGEEIFIILACSAISFFSTIAMIYASAVAWCGEEMAAKELFVMITRKWRRPAITWSYVALFNLGYSLLGAALVAVCLVIVKDPVPSFLVGGLLAVWFAFMYLYLSVVWKVGVVVSVVEEDCYGMGAIWKAEELMKGRKLQGFFLSLVLTLAGVVISSIFGFVVRGFERTEAAGLGLGLVFVNAACLGDFFMCVVFTAFYCDCKRGKGEEVEIEREERAGYSLISSACHVDRSIL